MYKAILHITWCTCSHYLLCFSSTLLASVSDDCTVAAKLLSENNSMFISRDHKDFVRGASWSANEKVLLTCGWDGQLLRHSLEQLGETIA